MPLPRLKKIKTRDNLLNLRSQAEDTASYYPRLMIEADRLAQSLVLGYHGRRQPGTGEEFWQFRSFVEGDSPKKIDWRQSAKRTQIHVRDMEWEAAQRFLFHYQPSARFEFKSETAQTSKRERCDLVFLTLCILLQKTGELFAWDGCPAPFSNNTNQINHFIDALKTEPENAASPSISASILPIFIDDALDPLDDVRARLMRFSGHHHGGVFIQVVDPAEIDFPYQDSIEFEGFSTGKIRFSKVQTVAETYRARVDAHQTALVDLCRRLGLAHVLCRTDESIETALNAVIQHWGQKTKTQTPMGRV